MSEIKRVTVSSRRPLRAGEWACVDAKCAHINAEKRSSCEICGKSKPRSKNRVGREIGKDAADKSKGLFSADDWVCTKCGNVNWARRSVCNVCNAPKLADVEVRTGYGGGYMDRQDVEYIERDDDEEFDEFGRKKRRRNKEDREKSADAPSTTAESKALIESGKLRPDDDDDDEQRIGTKSLIEDDEENEDEEDDDDDDGDLDKYDLTADPELVAFRLDPAKLAAKSAAEDDDARSGVSSDCSCSCSGGECSCEEEEEQPSVKKPRADEERRRSAERSDHRSDYHERSERRGDGTGGDHRSSSRSFAAAGSDRWRDRGGRGRSSDRDYRDRDRDRDRHRDYHR